MIVFSSLMEALRAGYQVEDRTEYGYLVTTQTSRGIARALVVLRESTRGRSR